MVSRTVFFSAGQQSALVTVPTVGDLIGEATESFGANLTNPSSSLTLGVDLATVDIVDDDRKAV